MAKLMNDRGKERTIMKDKYSVRGMLLTLSGGILWGFSGTCGQFFMQVKNISSNWLVPVRLLTAGVILLMLCFFRQGRSVFRVWKKDAVHVIMFAIFGMGMCKYTYFTAIGASNAGTATVLQYTGPVLILAYLSLTNMRFPRPVELLAITLTVIGTFLIATHGNPGDMMLSENALFWGLLSAVALAIYTVQPVRLLNEYGSMVITGWGMFIAGVMLFVFFRPWDMAVVIDWQSVLAMAAIIFAGTIIAFCTYMEGVRCVGPKKGSLYASVEPVSAMIFSSVWLHTDFGIMDLAGFFCIISTIFLLALDKKE